MHLISSAEAIAFIALPKEVIWSYFSFGVVVVIGILTILRAGDWEQARGLDKLVLAGPIFYAAPLAAFGTEHFTLATLIASFVPAWIPWHLFWAYFIGACFIAAPLSMVTRIQARLSASLVALTFLLFVLFMDIPGWMQDLRNRISLTLVLRELSFSGGALAMAGGLSEQRLRQVATTIARYFVAVPILIYSFEQFTHANCVPGVPLARLTPQYIYGHAIWTYLAAVIYAIAGIALLLGRKTRMAATWVGLAVFCVELVVYVPIAIVDRASLSNGLNYMADTLMFCGAVLLLASAMPHENAGGHRLEPQQSQEHAPQAVRPSLSRTAIS